VPLDGSVIDTIRHELSHASMPAIYHQQSRLQEDVLLKQYLTTEYSISDVVETEESYLTCFDTSFLLNTVNEVCAYVFSVTEIDTIPFQNVDQLVHKVDDQVINSYANHWEKQLITRRFIETMSEHTIPLSKRKNIYLEALSKDTSAMSSHAETIFKKTKEDISLFSLQRYKIVRQICDLYIHNSSNLYVHLDNPDKGLLS